MTETTTPTHLDELENQSVPSGIKFRQVPSIDREQLGIMTIAKNLGLWKELNCFLPEAMPHFQTKTGKATQPSKEP